MVYQVEVTLNEYPRGFHLITQEILQGVGTLPQSGILHVFIKHTSAGLTINENADATVREDFETGFNCLIPEDADHYVHTVEGSDDMPAHIKSTLVGSSVSVPITDHRLNLGIWQGIYLCEFRNRGGRRTLVLTVYS